MCGRLMLPACLVISGLIAVTIGLLQGRKMRLESRNGALWGQMPVRGLWLWAVLVGSRLIMTVIALAVGAKVAGSSRATPERRRPAAFRASAARPPTWRCWAAWPVGGWRGASGDGSP